MPVSPIRRRIVVLVASLALAVPFAATAKDAAKEAAPQLLKFGKDGAHATSKGKFKAPKDVVRNYAVDLKAGDSYAVAVDDGKSQVTFFSVFAPGAPQREGEGRTRMTVKPTADGTYIIHVFMTQGAVAKGAASSYELTVTKS
ncbi:MAG: hypothetical protein ACTHK2_08655 [Dokdonella sp.]|uniref:hypothetical protein n=1 Tax=Dokdonella sp. TaxID=2291710 RepID=UPI003F7EF23D